MLSDLHLFGLAAYGATHVAPYCTCGLIFTAKRIQGRASVVRAEWVEHVKKVQGGTETRNPLA